MKAVLERKHNKVIKSMDSGTRGPGFDSSSANSKSVAFGKSHALVVPKDGKG